MVEKIGILYHPKVEATLSKARELEKFISARGITVWLCSAWEYKKACSLLNGTDLVLTVGGDGTILRAAQAVIPAMVPITGINLGKLGFMAELDADEALEIIPELLEGHGWTDERNMIQAEVSSNDEKTGVYHALNDVVVARGAIARVINIDVKINGERLTSYRADGVILATATGSTGYAMAAGGPVMYPQSSDILVVPVAPHLSSLVPVVLPGTTVIELRIDTHLSATFSVDGHINLPLSSNDVITVKQSPYKTRFRRIRSENYFYSYLEDKLKGKQGGTGRKS
jgi:NAD+ kinase